MGELFGSEGLVAGNGDFLTVDLLGDGERERGPGLVACLLMGRKGIMAHGADAMVSEMALERVGRLYQNGEDMEHIVVAVFCRRHGDEWVAYLPYKTLGCIAAKGIVGIEVFQLHAQHSSLQLVETAVATAIVEDVFARRAVVGYRTEKRCKCLVVGGDGSSIAEGSEALAWIETVAYY